MHVKVCVKADARQLSLKAYLLDIYGMHIITKEKLKSLTKKLHRPLWLSGVSSTVKPNLLSQEAAGRAKNYFLVGGACLVRTFWVAHILLTTKMICWEALDHGTVKMLPVSNLQQSNSLIFYLKYRNAIMFCMNFTSANFASADGIAKKRSNLWGWLLVGVVNGHVDIEPMHASISVWLRHFSAARTQGSEPLQPAKQMEAWSVWWRSKPGNRALRSGMIYQLLRHRQSWDQPIRCHYCYYVLACKNWGRGWDGYCSFTKIRSQIT